jgi:hypothetical protein
MLDDDRPPIDALAAEPHDAAGERQLHEFAALYRALGSRDGSLRMTATDLDRHRADRALSQPSADAAWKPHGWLAAGLTALDGRPLGLIQVFDKEGGEFLAWKHRFAAWVMLRALERGWRPADEDDWRRCLTLSRRLSVLVVLADADLVGLGQRGVRPVGGAVGWVVRSALGQSGAGGERA